jgi:hypothetical protein
MVLAHLRKGETYRDPAAGSGPGRRPPTGTCTSLTVLATLAPTLEEAMYTAATTAYVVLDGTLRRVDRVDRVATASSLIGRTTPASTTPTGCTCRSSPTPAGRPGPHSRSQAPDLTPAQLGSCDPRSAGRRPE